MASLSNYAEDALINHLLRNSALTSPTTVYLALYTTDPGEADGGTEVSGGGYARQAVTFDAPSNGVTQNSSDVLFPEASASWGTITHVGIRTALTAGNPLFHGALAASKAIGIGDQFVIRDGQLSVSLA